MNTQNHLITIKSVRWPRQPAPFLLMLALILIVASAVFRFATALMSESNASTLPDRIANSTEFLREKVDLPPIQAVPLLDHSVVSWEGILAEPDPSSPMSPAYYHI